MLREDWESSPLAEMPVEIAGEAPRAFVSGT
jgi:hypothetical protein